MENIIKKLKEKYCNTETISYFSFNVNFSDFVSFKTSGEVAVLFEPSNINQLVEVLKFLKKEEIPFFIAGKGSNLFVTSKGYNGVVIRFIKHFNNLVFSKVDDKKTKVSCECGVSLSNVGIKSFDLSLSGFESLSLIPGTIGGAIYMNAGAYGIEIKDILSKVFILDYEKFELLEISLENCDFGYRKSVFMDKPYIIISCELILDKSDNKEDVLNKYKEFKEKRSSSQPLDKPSAGSTFKRPEGDFAGRLIEVSGLKGFSVGGAMVSNKHAGFVVNENNATPEDVYNCINYIKKEVYDKTGVLLNEEVCIYGE
ncbi:MAG: UDP-N-acetylmuramate dehydrogenase [Lachnospirales bacterium]